MCVRMCRGPSGLLLALRLKQCQQVCDETSQTIPHLSLFSILALLVSLSPRLSNLLFSHLFLSLVHYFFLIIYLPLSVSLILTHCGHCYSSCFLYLLYYFLSLLRNLFLSLFATHQRSINHFGPRWPDPLVSCDVWAMSCVPECTSDKANKTKWSIRNKYTVVGQSGITNPVESKHWI